MFILGIVYLITGVIMSFFGGIFVGIYLSDGVQSEQEPCASCEYTEGSPWCIEHCPYDVSKKISETPIGSESGNKE